MASAFLQPYKIVITRFFFPVLYFKLLRKIYRTYDQIFGMCASINNKNHSYKPGKSLITQKPSINFMEKNTGKKVVTQGKHRENTGNFISAGMWPPCNNLPRFTFEPGCFINQNQLKFLESVLVADINILK